MSFYVYALYSIIQCVAPGEKTLCALTMLHFLPSLDFVDACGTEPNCFTVIDSYSTTQVAARTLVSCFQPESFVLPSFLSFLNPLCYLRFSPFKPLVLTCARTDDETSCSSSPMVSLCGIRRARAARAQARRR